MKTKHIFIITGVLSVIGCAYFESSPTYSSEAIRRAELGVEQQITTDYEDDPETAYIITLNNDSISVIDPNTGKTILIEKYDSKSALAKAILKDNE